MIFLLTLLLSVLITIALVPVFSRLAISANVVDIPNERKVHTIPVPRIGGVAMALGAFVPILCWNRAGSFVQAYLLGAAVLVVFGLIDDFRELSPRIKFAGQFIAALIAVFWGGVTISSLGMLFSDNLLLPGWLALPLTVIAIVGVTNAINLSDGLDGLAGGICLLSFCCISYLAYLVGNAQIGLIALSLAGVIFGFLRFNTGLDFHGRRRQPVSRLFGNCARALPDPGEYFPQSAAAADNPRVSGTRYPGCDADPDRPEALPLFARQKPFSPQPDGLGAAPS